MSSEERQRILREQGSRPAEAETQTRAASSREALNREDAKQRGQVPSSDEPSPPAEESEERPVPRR